jgi:hypothetical protein
MAKRGFLRVSEGLEGRSEASRDMTRAAPSYVGRELARLTEP